MAKKSAPKKANVKAKTKVKAKPAAKAPAKKAVSKAAAKGAKKPAKKVSKQVSQKEPKQASKPALKLVAKASASQSKSLARFNPLDDRIVIERVVAEERTAGGLYIPDTAQEKPTTGRVVAVGRGHRDAKGRTRPCDVKVGDRVLFTAWSGSEIEVDGVSYVIMRETDLLGVTTV